METTMTLLDKTRYAELLHEKHPHVIRTEEENESALREVEALMARGENITPAEEELLALLTVLIEHFEEERYALQPAPPREILRSLMEARGMTQSELGKFFSSKGIASEVLAGKREISKMQARKLGVFFHVPASVFFGA
jgi:HTH-type transcriptional regulator / antitoxin HigA